MKEFEDKSLDLLSKQMSLLKEVYKIETTVDLNDNDSMLEIVCPSHTLVTEKTRVWVRVPGIYPYPTLTPDLPDLLGYSSDTRVFTRVLFY
jgi:hypothetical protein